MYAGTIFLQETHGPQLEYVRRKQRASGYESVIFFVSANTNILDDFFFFSGVKLCKGKRGEESGETFQRPENRGTLDSLYWITKYVRGWFGVSNRGSMKVFYHKPLDKNIFYCQCNPTAIESSRTTSTVVHAQWTSVPVALEL